MLLPQWFFLLFRNVRGLETKSQKEIIARHDSYFSVHRGFYFPLSRLDARGRDKNGAGASR